MASSKTRLGHSSSSLLESEYSRESAQCRGLAGVFGVYAHTLPFTNPGRGRKCKHHPLPPRFCCFLRCVHFMLGNFKSFQVLACWSSGSMTSWHAEGSSLNTEFHARSLNRVMKGGNTTGAEYSVLRKAEKGDRCITLSLPCRWQKGRKSWAWNQGRKQSRRKKIKADKEVSKTTGWLHRDKVTTLKESPSFSPTLPGLPGRQQ